MTDPDLLVVVNVAAGTARSGRVGAAVGALRELGRTQGRDVELATTADVGDLGRTLRALGDRRLVVLGGDGTVHAAAQVLYDTGRLRSAGPIGVVPLGTGNDLAGSLGIPTDPAAAARIAIDGTPRDMELIVAENGQIAVNAVHLGIGATAAAKGAGAKRRLGKVGLGRLGYSIGAVAAGLTEPGWRLRVAVDGEVLHHGEERVLMVAMGLGGTVGGGTLLVPAANPYDGLVDVVVAASVGPVARFVYATQVRKGRHIRRADVHTMRGRTVDVQALAGDAFHSNSDGELRGPFTSRHWAIEGDAWQALVPPR